MPIDEQLQAFTSFVPVQPELKEGLQELTRAMVGGSTRTSKTKFRSN